jgi:UDP-N-acetylmuramoylalanine--D-glutamate ligase
MDLKGKRVVVVGLGKSGRSAAALCRDRGAQVVGTDSATQDQLPPSLPKLGVELALGGHKGVDFLGADLIVISPGVPSFPELEAAAKNGVEIIGEVELASRFLTAPIIAVGGTNGKSTATTLVGHLVEAAEKHAFVGANLGDPACEAVGQELDVVVYEVSSFQMERVPTFRPKVSVLLNITEDHLDRYPSFQAYADAKGNAFVHQKAGDVAVVPFGNDACIRQARRGKGRIVTFGTSGDYVVEAHDVVERATGIRFNLEESDLHGSHNYMNAAAAIAAARALDIDPEAIREGLRWFRALPHRMGLVGRVRGVNFYDDSKATNVGAAVTALLGLTEEHGVLIAGGRDKMGSYDPLVAAIKEKARAVVVLGEAADRLAKAIGTTVPVERARSIADAVDLAFHLAKKGDAVLLSPACSSYDMFKSYADRGDRFAAAVEQLEDRVRGDGDDA